MNITVQSKTVNMNQDVERRLIGTIHDNRDKLQAFVQSHGSLIELQSFTNALARTKTKGSCFLGSKKSLKKLTSCCARISQEHAYPGAVRGDACRAGKLIEEVHAAVDQLVVANYAWLQSFAASFHSYLSNADDLAQEGVFGLMRAAYRFDASRKVRFRTYAEHWVRQYIVKHLQDTQCGFRMPSHFMQLRNRYWETVRNCERGNKPIPNTEEMAEKLGTTVKSVKHIEEKSQTVLSLDFTYGDSDTEAIEHIGAVEIDMTSNLEEEELRKSVYTCLDMLPERERDIIERHYGFGKDEEQSLSEIAASMGITRERARQIEIRGLRMLTRFGLGTHDATANAA